MRALKRKVMVELVRVIEVGYLYDYD